MCSKYLCLPTLSLLAPACILFQRGQATDRSFTVPKGEWERTSRALNEYRILAAADDEALLHATEEPVEPGMPMPTYLV
jgi:hypothetical protein